MRLNGFQCDSCAKQHLLPPTLLVDPYTRCIPEGWIVVYPGGLGEHEALLFCDRYCLIDWAGKDLPPKKEPQNEWVRR